MVAAVVNIFCTRECARKYSTVSRLRGPRSGRMHGFCRGYQTGVHNSYWCAFTLPLGLVALLIMCTPCLVDNVLSSCASVSASCRRHFVFLVPVSPLRSLPVVYEKWHKTGWNFELFLSLKKLCLFCAACTLYFVLDYRHIVYRACAMPSRIDYVLSQGTLAEYR